ncbi:Alpha/beta hydrolase family protein [Novipirellula aureliae]|uniref:Alpha/beta hydrolase family protein n=1 Tax=Novipirellula aureliae TaxID=2527966 RepID=A0A5C6E6T1_9BACT|nr:alpha/beta fold hydrolase [Novipirellula aureliae]TWU45353.1 Alpha/beta hydrolase family protein [Novipirellula aureliae]
MSRRPINRFRSRMLSRMILRPSSHPLDHGEQRRVMVPTKLGPLETFLRDSQPPTETPDLVILKFPGTAGRGERSTAFPTPFLNARRVHVWTWNPPGYGQSAGRASLENIANSALCFYDHVALSYDRSDGSRPPIWMLGNSLGCATALGVSANADFKPTGLILRNPPPLDHVVRHVAKKYPLGRFVKSITDRLDAAMNALLTAPRVDVPALFFQSEFDTLVLPEMQQMIRDAYAGPQYLVELKGIGHDGIIDDSHGLAVSNGVDWLCNQSGV